MDAFVAEIRLFPFNFAPKGWALCAGQIMPISQNTALFSLLGTTYGGDGRVTFALPNLQGAVAMHQGTGPGLSFYALGQSGGDAAVTLVASENAAHNHLLNADAEVSTSTTPASNIYMAGHYPGSPGGQMAAYSTQAPNVTLSPATVAPAGTSAPHNNMMPYLAMNYCIALQGIFPQRS